MQATTNAVTKTASAAKTAGQKPEREPAKLLMRIGSTTYMVAVRFSDNAKETMEDKLLRIAESEVRKNAS
jgi:hypothetical protein